MTLNTEIIIIGAGYAGSVIAEQLASAGKSVLIIEKREHIAGNAYDEFDKQGIFVHRYGPHIFHTNSQRIFEYLSSFTKWRAYEHHVLAKVDKQLLPIPINQNTINQLYGLNLDETGIKNFFEKVREIRNPILTSEDVVLNSVGSELCDKFFRGYTRKQWGLELSELSAGVAARIPTRTNCDNRYFTDKYQTMPLDGYTKMFEHMLESPKIQLELGVDFFKIKDKIKNQAKYIVYTGAIDTYFNYCFGKLPYRSLQFQPEHINNIEQFQKVGTINYPNDYDFTRITEFKHLTGQQHSGTSIVREYPQAEGEPYYPIPRQENENLYKKYQALANQEKNVSFVGRLAQYRYYNMDQVVGAALTEAQKILELINK